jgi:RHS repeat-associated protein
VYTYDAIGNKLRKSATINSTTTFRYYASSFEYGNIKSLELIHFDEGVVGRDTSDGTYEYEYFLKDHLGNTRVTFKPSGSTCSLLQTSDYYPFGMVSYKTGSDNKYLYNGKEIQQELSLEWYDYGARFYDPQLGRFMTVDPLAEDYDNQSPYLYAHNNPVRFTDYLGMGAQDEVDKDKDKKKKDEEAKKKEEEKKKEAEKKAEESKKKEEKKEEFKFELSEEDQEAIMNLIQGGGVLKKVGKEIIVGAEAAKLLIIAKKLKLNISSSTTKEIIKNLDQTVESFISKYRKGSIKSEFPAEYLGQTVEKALKSGNTTVRKLLTDKRFVK